MNMSSAGSLKFTKTSPGVKVAYLSSRKISFRKLSWMLERARVHQCENGYTLCVCVLAQP
jgi:hypothetical protein